MRNVPKHGQAFKIFASRHLPALTLASKGDLYAYRPATNTWRTVKAVTPECCLSLSTTRPKNG